MSIRRSNGAAPFISRLMNHLESVPGWSRLARLLDAWYLRRFRICHRSKKPAVILADKFSHTSGVAIIICKGNICRSPFLAEYLNKKAPNGSISFDSAALRIQGNITPPLNAVENAADLGIDLSSHRAKPLAPEAVESADLIIGMEPIHHLEFCLKYFRWRHKFLLLRTLETEPDSLKLPDPFGQDQDVFHKCYKALARDGDILFSAIQELREQGSN